MGGNLEGFLVVQVGVVLLDNLQLLLHELVVGRGGAGLLVLLGGSYMVLNVVSMEGLHHCDEVVPLEPFLGDDLLAALAICMCVYM